MVEAIFLGPDKAGSSYLFEYFYLHPAVHVPGAKDLYFFDKYYDRGFDWYHAHFPQGKLGIDVSHDYLFSEDAAIRIAAYSREVKAFIVRRDPVARSFSHYLYLIKSGILNCSLEDAVKIRPDIISNSEYTKNLELYRAHNIDVRVFDFALLQRDEVEFQRQLCRFLEIDHLEVRLGKVRAARAPRSYYVNKVLKKFAVAMRFLGMHTWLGALKRSPIITALTTKPVSREMAKDEELFLRRLLREEYN